MIQYNTNIRKEFYLQVTIILCFISFGCVTNNINDIITNAQDFSDYGYLAFEITHTEKESTDIGIEWHIFSNNTNKKTNLNQLVIKHRIKHKSF